MLKRLPSMAGNSFMRLNSNSNSIQIQIFIIIINHIHFLYKKAVINLTVCFDDRGVGAIEFEDSVSRPALLLSSVPTVCKKESIT